VKVFDDLIPSEVINRIEDLLLSPNFPWYFNSSVVDKAFSNNSYMDDDKSVDACQFTHILYSNYGGIQSQFYNIITPFIDLLGKRVGEDLKGSLVRAKANLLTRHNYSDDHYNIPHVDLAGFKSKSLLYYVNSSDGDTFIFNESEGANTLTVKERVTPLKGRCLYFDSSLYHASSCPKIFNTRAVINFVFRVT
jgi:hypothetical protein